MCDTLQSHWQHAGDGDRRAPEEIGAPAGSDSRRRVPGEPPASSGIGRAAPSHGWQPLAGAALLERLRITGRPRPPADPELATRIRRTLEQGLASELGSSAPDRLPALVVTKDRLSRVLACERHQVATEFGEREPTAALACGALIDVLFRQLVTVGAIGDPMADGLTGLRLDDRQRELATWIERMDPAGRDELRVEVERQVDGLRERWPLLTPGWLPRTQEAMRVGLLGGAVELAARVDLALGRPTGGRGFGGPRRDQVGDPPRRAPGRAPFLCPGRDPSESGTALRGGHLLHADGGAGRRSGHAGAAGRRGAPARLTGARSLFRLAEGHEPQRTPNGLCGRCAALPDCDVGRAWVERTTEGGHRGDRARDDGCGPAAPR